MISNNFFILIYGLSLILFLNSSNFLLFWILMEINLIIFIFLMMFLFDPVGKVDSKLELGLYYFIFQSLGSILFLFSFVQNLDFLILGGLIFLLGLSIKVGIFPGFAWVYKMSEFCSVTVLFFLISIQKIPLFMLMFSFYGWEIFLFLVPSFLLGTFFLFLSFSFKYLLISSSIASCFWVYILFFKNETLFFLFFFFYSAILLLFLISSSNYPLKNFFFESMEIYKILTFMFLVGLPPLSLFFFKLDVVSFLKHLESWEGFIFFWLLSFMGLLGYTKFFFSSLISSSSFFMKNEFCFSKMSFFFCSSFFFWFFLI